MLTPATVYDPGVAASLRFPPTLEMTSACLALLVTLGEPTERRSLILFRCQKSNSLMKRAAVAL